MTPTTASAELVTIWCEYCGRRVDRKRGPTDAARYCGASCKKAAYEDARRLRREREGHDVSHLVEIVSAARWRLAVHERYRAGSIVGDRPRCESSGKVRYDHLCEAWVAAFIDFDDAPRLHAYVCPGCKGAHLGNAKFADGRAARRRAKQDFTRATRQMLATIRDYLHAKQKLHAARIDACSEVSAQHHR